MSNINLSSMLSVGTVLNGRYRIERHLSSGGFGNTYMATNLTFNDVVAVKEFFLRGISQRDGDSSTISVSNPENRELFTEQLEKFKKEAQRIRQLRSQHIVHVHDLFEANCTAYYVMDYIDGESLGARLKRTNMPLTEAETRKYFGQVLDALETIHGAGLCHMDLKPENIMVDKADNAILIDFGASKRSDNERFTSTVSGVSYTNGYAPPEQLEQDTAHFGPWTDIYALGATLYKLLTNRKPPMPSAIYTDMSPDKHEVLPFPDSVSQQMRNLILQMMAVRWTDRPQSVAALRTMMTQPDVQTQVFGFSNGTQPTNKTITQGIPSVKNQNKERKKKSFSNKWMYVVIGALSSALLVIGVSLLLRQINKGRESVEKPLSSVNNLSSDNKTDYTKTIPEEEKKEELVEKEDVEEYEDNGLFEDKEIAVTDGWTLKMVAVYGGSFLMGGTSEQGSDIYSNEMPAHRVSLDNYYIGQTEVTQALWKAVMGYNPSVMNKGDLYPVENVSYSDCQAFVNRLNQLTEGRRPQGRDFRIPTEAEWEYAARGGQSGGYQYSGSNSVGSVAWYNNNANGKTHHVKTLGANGLGIYDMSGNVSEWTADWFDADYYSRSEEYNPCNRIQSQQRAGRGGSFASQPRNCRVSDRHYYSPNERSGHLGLRVAM